MSIDDVVYPADYPLEAMKSVSDAVFNQRGTQPKTFEQFSSAWHAVSLRFLACTEHHEAFTASILDVGDSPLPRSRYEQERELFGFFYTGLSVLECFYYGVYAIGHLAKPDKFPFSEEKRRVVSIEITGKKWDENFHGSDLATHLDAIRKSADYIHWKNVRNVLTHRTAPGRHFGVRLGNELPERESTRWFQGLVIGADTTAMPRRWLAESLSELASAAAISVPLILS